MERVDHPEVPDHLRAAHRKYEYGRYLWEEQVDPPRGYLEHNFSQWPEKLQEKHLAEAVIMAVRGTPSVLIAPRVMQQCSNMKGRSYPPIEFCVTELVDEVQGKYIDPILGLASHRAIIWRFAKERVLTYHDGLINQAFVASLIGVCLELHEYICVLWDQVQDPSKGAPLSLLLTSLSPYIPLFQLLRELVDKHEGKCGSTVIKLLEEARVSNIGNPTGEVAARALLDHTCKPFFAILDAWIYEGKNVASWEFPLTRPAGSTSFMQWELTPSGLPMFLQSSASKILQCGKLALILKQADQQYNPVREKLVYSTESDYYSSRIERVFCQGNSEVLRLLRINHRLQDKISFLHHYLLCGSGDWVATFMDHCWLHPNCSLDRTVRDARWDELQRAIKNSCESSTVAAKYPKEWIESLRLEPATKSLIRMVKKMARMQEPGYLTTNTTEDAMRLDLEVIQAVQLTTFLPWPLSLVVHQNAMPKYHLLGRLILRVKGLLYALHRFRRRRGAKLTGQHAASFRSLCALRGSMIQFLSNLEMYLLLDVINPGLAKLKAGLSSASTVEDLMRVHDGFLDECISATMATSEGLYKRMERVFLTIRLFASSLQTMEKSEKHEREAIKRFQIMFRDRFGELLKEMQTSSSGKGDSEVKFLRHMLSRLDFNKYYLKEKLYGEGELI
eukprot:TRINITY_DN33854_c0_g1_i1.p1 TRINITY_DN33854_c0_g1~~TRINITY_DN33854_c0_g1_i1.p1  ORF type:complete len:687 (+),score=73.75 TRINITY_DN33854_c0_g1_i1:42-2063(+)